MLLLYKTFGKSSKLRAYSYDQKDVNYIKNAISKVIGKMEASFKSKVKRIEDKLTSQIISIRRKGMNINLEKVIGVSLMILSKGIKRRILKF